MSWLIIHNWYTMLNPVSILQVEREWFVHFKTEASNGCSFRIITQHKWTLERSSIFSSNICKSQVHWWISLVPRPSPSFCGGGGAWERGYWWIRFVSWTKSQYGHQILKNCSFEASIAPSTTGLSPNTGTTLTTMTFVLSSGILSMSIACTVREQQLHKHTVCIKILKTWLDLEACSSKPDGDVTPTCRYHKNPQRTGNPVMQVRYF